MDNLDAMSFDGGSPCPAAAVEPRGPSEPGDDGPVADDDVDAAADGECRMASSRSAG